MDMDAHALRRVSVCIITKLGPRTHLVIGATVYIYSVRVA
jgi:hypothetical protein